MSNFRSNFIYNGVIRNEIHCNNREYLGQIQSQFDEILDYVSISSEHLPMNVHHQKKTRVGWNDNCKNLYKNARNAFLNCVRNGRV